MFAAVMVRLSIGVQCLNYIRRYPHYCEADDYECGGKKLGVEVMKCGVLETCKDDDEQIDGEYHIFMFVDPAHLLYSST